MCAVPPLATFLCSCDVFQLTMHTINDVVSVYIEFFSTSYFPARAPSSSQPPFFLPRFYKNAYTVSVYIEFFSTRAVSLHVPSIFAAPIFSSRSTKMRTLSQYILSSSRRELFPCTCPLFFAAPIFPSSVLQKCVCCFISY